MTDYDKLRELAHAATPGPYHAKPIEHAEYALCVYLDRHDGYASHLVANRLTEADAAFMAAAHPDVILNLLEDLRITRAERDAEKKKRAQQSKDYTADALRWDEAFTNIRADAYNDGWANALEAHAHNLDAQGYAPFARWARRTAKDTK